jgi:adenylate cyclase
VRRCWVKPGSHLEALAKLGAVERAKEWAERGSLLDPDNMNMRYNIACTQITDLGDHDAALDMLGPYVAGVGAEALDWIKADPDMDAVRGDPRFQNMIRQANTRLGMPSE